MRLTQTCSSRNFADYLKILFIATILQPFIVNSSHSNQNECDSLQQQPNAEADIDSQKIFQTFNFEAKWAQRSHKHFWKSLDFDFESRYVNSGNTNTTHVFVIPFSHVDAGWLVTFEDYYYSYAKKIIHNAIVKLDQYKNMTFVWSEMIFLSKYWEEAKFSQKKMLKKLIDEGRFEILTGSWVMPCEGTTSLFGLVDQLVEGHQWLKNTFRIFPKFAFSLDPFGHSNCMPYLLKKADIVGMMIQRIHYAWKHFFAEHRNGDFLWFPRFSNKEEDAIVCLNAQYDLYPTKHSCGPSPNTCMRFNFREIPDKREEHLMFMRPVNKFNTRTLAETLVGQYGRSASLTQHNKVATLLGGDVSFLNIEEFDQQYNNYTRLFNYINSHEREFHTKVKFGTLSSYFQAVNQSNYRLPRLNGDFFPYSDILFSFAPAYWTGYFSTRPFFKSLLRQSEDELQKAEILFAFTHNLLRQRNIWNETLSRNYDNLVHTRRTVSLMQHHDAVTGTSPRSTMTDYTRKLSRAFNFAQQIQKVAIQNIWKGILNLRIPPLVQEKIRTSPFHLTGQRKFKLYESDYIVKKVVIFNSLGWRRSHLVRMAVECPNVTVRNTQSEIIVAQINPKIEKSQRDTKASNRYKFELLFVAELPPLSLVTYEIHRPRLIHGSRRGKAALASPAKSRCRNCNGTFDALKIPEIVFSNSEIRARLDPEFGLLQGIESLRLPHVRSNVSLRLRRYDAGFGSGAYLLRPFVSTDHPILNNENTSLYVFEGPVMSEVVLVSDSIKLSTWIVHRGSSEIQSLVFLSNEANSSALAKFGEYFMRFQSDLNSTEHSVRQPETERIYKSRQEKIQPTFFTDTNGFSVEKRVHIKRLPYQANHYPITSFCYIQNAIQKQRLFILVDRTHGVSSPRSGRLELIFDRRLPYDDGRGMGEGVLDPETTISNYAISVESFIAKQGDFNQFGNWESSLFLQRMSKCLNHQPSLFLYDALNKHKNGRLSLLSNELPPDVFLLNLRTISQSFNKDSMSIPSERALMILQRLGHRDARSHPLQCSMKEKMDKEVLNSTLLLKHFVRRTNLVGTREYNDTVSFNTTVRLPLSTMYQLDAYLLSF